MYDKFVYTKPQFFGQSFSSSSILDADGKVVSKSIYVDTKGNRLVNGKSIPTLINILVPPSPPNEEPVPVYRPTAAPRSPINQLPVAPVTRAPVFPIARPPVSTTGKHSGAYVKDGKDGAYVKDGRDGAYIADHRAGSYVAKGKNGAYMHDYSGAYIADPRAGAYVPDDRGEYRGN